ncbi:negative regulation of gluconeogenesis [Colletotrichum karsti]|uniref:Negative regulation of gluconeogenesis n=1 Tax=Colletotrichum karsti TaxID=1095194 RepID=A0A9P6I1D5_9PEZI|nr:negative regulation of gluconeogenesis [Colletotrichum karsti]KAF9874040.1 negative regulation of gluconeogenesis [Colletotrichum karsti]
MADHEHSTIKHQDHLLLDQPLLRLPYELLRKNFRQAHFTVEKESTAIKSLLKETATNSVNGRATPDDVLKNLDTMIARMRGVKRKLAASADEEARLTRQTAARISHLGDLYGMHSVEDVKYEAWSRARLDRLLVDYLLRHGYNESAKALTAERGLEDLVDVETFVQMSRIQEALRNGSVVEALAWCQENKKELRKMDSNLEFMLRFQQYIELVRTQSQPKLLEAIAHAKRYLLSYKSVYPEDLSRAFGLLAYSPNAATDVYADLYSDDRWHTLADLFTTTHNSLLMLPSFPLLHIALSSGLSALKTPACHSANSSHVAPSETTATNAAATAGTQSVCPICSTELNDLARNVPYAHHTKSYVEHDLLLLPNSRAYGKERLEDYAKKSGLPPDQVRDLRTGEVYPADKLKKVFIT